MKRSDSGLFYRPGYISVHEYLDDIRALQNTGTWKLPMSIRDRIHLLFLQIFVRFSWFSHHLFVQNSSSYSPAYALLLTYLKKKRFVDALIERNVHVPGYFCFSLMKYKNVPNSKERLVHGQGGDLDPATAFSKAIGELLERSVTGLHDLNTRVITATPVWMRKHFPIVYPPKHHRFLKVQTDAFPRLRHDPNQPIDWVRGKNLITHEKTWIPRQMTSWLSHRMKSVSEAILMHATSNGSAGYFTREGAVLRGLLEVVQRDAFLVHWLTMIPPEVISQETLPVSIRETIRKIESIGVTVFVLNTTAIPIPSVIVVAINFGSEKPQIGMTGGSGLTFEQAIGAALREAVLGIEMFTREDSPSESQARYEYTEVDPFVSGLDKVPRQLYWRGSERVERFRWFISGRSVSYVDVCHADIHHGKNDTSRLRACLGVLRELGSEYYPVVYHPVNPIQESLGFFVAQVFIPKAFSLYLVEWRGTFASDRLAEFAASKQRDDWQLNPYPHGFP